MVLHHVSMAMALLPPSPPAPVVQSQGPKLLPSSAQTWTPLLPPGQSQLCAPGVQPGGGGSPSVDDVAAEFGVLSQPQAVNRRQSATEPAHAGKKVTRMANPPMLRIDPTLIR